MNSGRNKGLWLRCIVLEKAQSSFNFFGSWTFSPSWLVLFLFFSSSILAWEREREWLVWEWGKGFFVWERWKNHVLLLVSILCVLKLREDDGYCAQLSRFVGVLVFFVVVSNHWSCVLFIVKMYDFNYWNNDHNTL